MPAGAAPSLPLSTPRPRGCGHRASANPSGDSRAQFGKSKPLPASSSPGLVLQAKDSPCTLRALCNSHILTSVLRLHRNFSQLSSAFFKGVTPFSTEGHLLSDEFRFDAPGSSPPAEPYELSNMAQRLMDSQTSKPTCISPSCLNSMEKMTEWLEERLPSGDEIMRSWGRVPGTKCVSNLWTEFVTGEISLEDSSPPKRTVEVVSVSIVDERGRVLVESQQMLSDGSLRLRNRPLSEKMKPGETVEEASFRGIQEELGAELGAPTNVSLDFETYRLEIQERESFSYPGLLSHYIVHHLNAHVQNLPQEDFTTLEDEAPHVQLQSSQDASANWATRQASDDSDVNALDVILPATNIFLHQKPVGVKVHYWSWRTQ